MNRADRPQIVVTGAGLLCALGTSVAEAWGAALGGRGGIKSLTAIEQELPAGADGGESALEADELGGQTREAVGARRAIDEALAAAGIVDDWPAPPDRCGIVLGTTLAGMRSGGEYIRTGDCEPLSKFLAEHTLQTAAAGLPVRGMCTTTSSACASGLSSIALAMTLLESNELDLVIAGGYDPLSEYAYAGFRSLRLVAESPLMPFSKNRAGMKLGEAWGIVILERAADACARDTSPLVVLRGFGESSDAHHLTQPHPLGDGAKRAIYAAIERSNMVADEIDLISAHATATPANDAAECAAYRDVLGDHFADTSVVAFKSHLGHSLGGAGAAELILTAMALIDQTAPPTVGTSRSDLEFDSLGLVFDEPQKRDIRHTLNMSMGFGGANAAMIMGRPSPGRVSEQHASIAAAMTDTSRDVLITGVGIVTPQAVGNAAMCELLRAGGSATEDLAAIDETAIEHLVNARRSRRLSSFAKVILAATTEACRDAGIEDIESFAAQSAAILGTAHGAANYSEAYYRQIVEEGIDAANPMLFAEGVPNVGSAHLSLMLGLRGGSQTIVGSRNAGLDALLLAAARIRNGEWDRAIIGAAEEESSVVRDAYRHFGLKSADAPSSPFGEFGGFVAGNGAAVFVLESRRAAAKRGARERGVVVGGLAGRGERGDTDSICDVATRLLSRSQSSLVLSSANGTWIDEVEARAISRASPTDEPHLAVVTAMTPTLGETFSVTPLAGIAAILLTGSAPRLELDDCAAARIAPSVAASGNEDVARFSVLCTSFSGLVGTVEIETASKPAS